MPILSNLIVRIGASTDDYDKKVNKALGKAQRFAQSVTAAGEAMAIGFSAPILAAGGAAIKAASDMQSLEMGLKAVMKTTDATTAEMAKLREVAKLPGLGLEEAVKGSVRLQILGNSADESRRIMRELGNALATVGGGREDFSEVIRQLSQLGAVGKVTKENLDPIVERIPQIAAIIKEKFGAQALGDPAKTFEKMGISSQQFIRILVDELAKGERAGNTYKNSWENIQMAAKDAAAEFGKSLLPVAQTVLNEFFVPGVEKAKQMADAFNALSPSTRQLAIEMTALAAAVPLFIVGLATMIEKTSIVMAALFRFKALLGVAFTELMTLGSGLSAQVIAMSGVAAGTAGATAALGLFAAAATIGAASVADLTIKLWQWYEAEKLAAGATDNLSYSTEKLLERVRAHKPEIGALEVRYRAGQMSLEDFSAAVREAAKGIETKTPKVGALAAGMGSMSNATTSASKAVDKHTKSIAEAKTATMELLALQERMRQADADRTDAVRKLADLMREYNAVTFDQIALNAQAADAAARYFRVLENPPDIRVPGIGGGMKDVPKPPMPVFPGSFEEFRKMGENIGDLGMQTREQHEAMKRSAKDAAREASKAYRQVSTVMTDLSRGIADVIFKGGKLGDMFKNVAMQAAQSITRLLIEGALKKLQDKLFDIGGIMGKVFGTSGGGGGKTPGVPGVSGGGGGAAAGASQGVMGAVNMVSGIVSAVSGVIGNFQMYGMNKTLDLIEKEVRYSQIHLLNLLEKNNEFLPNLKNIWESLIRMEQRQMTVAGAGNVNITINSSGGDPRAMLDALTRELKQLGVIPR